MILLPNLDILETAFNSNRSDMSRQIINYLYNTNNKICLNKSLLEFFESRIESTDFFKSFITEISDTDRLVVEESDGNKLFQEQIIEINKNSKESFLIPITLKNDETLAKEIPKIMVIENIKKLNRNWIISEILTKGNFTVFYDDFNDDQDIQKFFDMIFSVPNFIKSVKIFNREQDSTLLKKLKGSNIDYYTLLFNISRDIHIHKETLKGLKADLGGKLKLFFTHDKRIIHERKIIIEGLIISSDNSFQNLIIDEPTWDITVTFDKEKYLKWVEKCYSFNRLT